MSRNIRFVLSTLASIGLGASLLFGQRARGGPFGSATPPTPVVTSYFYPTLEWYGGYSPPYPVFSPAYNNPPNYWWTGYYPEADPRQEGYNPSSGYPAETVKILLLKTFPAKASVTPDGVCIGTADFLGPTQLPMGEHSLRVEAAAYEAFETVLKVERPGVQQLEVRLNPIVHTAKPGPRK